MRVYSGSPGLFYAMPSHHNCITKVWQHITAALSHANGWYPVANVENLLLHRSLLNRLAHQQRLIYFFHFFIEASHYPIQIKQYGRKVEHSTSPSPTPKKIVFYIHLFFLTKRPLRRALSGQSGYRFKAVSGLSNTSELLLYFPNLSSLLPVRLCKTQLRSECPHGEI